MARPGTIVALVLAGLLLAGAAQATDRWFVTSDGMRLHYIEQGRGHTIVMVPGWSFASTINSVSIPYIQSGTLTIARNTTAIFAGGSQTAYDNFAGPIKVSGKMTAIVATQADPWSAASPAQGLTRDQIPVVLVFTDPNDTNSPTITFTMSKTQFMEPKRTQGKAYVEVEANFEAIADATDATTGFSPVATSTLNNTSAAYN